jgi:hypothetical protein
MRKQSTKKLFLCFLSITALAAALVGCQSGGQKGTTVNITNQRAQSEPADGNTGDTTPNANPNSVDGTLMVK